MLLFVIATTVGSLLVWAFFRFRVSYRCHLVTGRELGRQYIVGLVLLGVLSLSSLVPLYLVYFVMDSVSSLAPNELWPFLLIGGGGLLMIAPFAVMLIVNYRKRERLFLVRNVRRGELDAVLMDVLKRFGLKEVPARRRILAQTWELSAARVVVRGATQVHIFSLEVCGENREVVAELKAQLAAALQSFVETARPLEPPQFSLRTALLAILLCGSAGTLYWHWDPWVKQFDFRGTFNVVRYAISANGRLAAFGTNAGSVQIWDLETGSKVAELSIHTANIEHLEFDARNALLLTACSDGVVRIWDTKSGNERTTLIGGEGASGSFSPDGKKFVVFSNKKGEATVYDADSGESITRFKHGDSFVRALFSPDSQTLLTAGDDNMIHIWRLIGQTRERDLEGKIDSIPELSFSPDGKVLLAFVPGRAATAWEFGTGKCLYTFEQTNIIYTAFSPDSRYILTRSCTGWPVWVRDAATGNCIHTLTGDGGDPGGGTWSPDGQQIMVSTEEYLERWDAKTFRKLGSIPQRDAGVATYCPDNQHVLAGDSPISLWVRRRADGSVLALPELWTTVLLAVALVWSFLRDQRGRA